jgi:hypothetical protein
MGRDYGLGQAAFSFLFTLLFFSFLFHVYISCTDIGRVGWLQASWHHGIMALGFGLAFSPGGFSKERGGGWRE